MINMTVWETVGMKKVGLLVCLLLFASACGGASETVELTATTTTAIPATTVTSTTTTVPATSTTVTATSTTVPATSTTVTATSTTVPATTSTVTATTTVPAATTTDLGISGEDRDVLLGQFFQARDAVIAGDLFFADCANKKIGEKVFELLERSPTDEELLLLEECLQEATIGSATTTTSTTTITPAITITPITTTTELQIQIPPDEYDIVNVSITAPVDPSEVQFFIPENVSPFEGLKGYLQTSSSLSPADSNYGQSFYTGIWSTFDEYLPIGFQRGHGTWIIPDNRGYTEPLCPVGTVARDNWPERAPSYSEVFQTIEGGPGYWLNTRFPDPQMKYRLNLITDCYTSQTSSPGWNWGGTDNLDDQAGLAQISNKLLYAPDGITFKRGTHGDFLGQAWMSLPLTAGLSENSSVGVNNWTLFLNAKNFSGPTAYMTPEGWNRITDGYEPAEGRGLDSRLPAGDRSWHLSDEIGLIGAHRARHNDSTFISLPRINYPVDEMGRTIYHQDLTTYSESSIYDEILAFLQNGEAILPQELDSKGAFSRSIDSTNFGWSFSGYANDIQIEDILETSTFGNGDAWGIQWLDENSQGKFPQYYEIRNGLPVPISENEVPSETQLKDLVLPPLTANDFDAHYNKSEAWPEPEGGRVYTSDLIDGSSISYGWYKFVEQPAIRKLNLSEAKKAQLQSVVEAIHATDWGPSNPVMKEPTFGKLAEIDSALILTPPAGLEVGYVPVALNQFLTP